MNERSHSLPTSRRQSRRHKRDSREEESVRLAAPPSSSCEFLQTHNPAVARQSVLMPGASRGNTVSRTSMSSGCPRKRNRNSRRGSVTCYRPPDRLAEASDASAPTAEGQIDLFRGVAQGTSRQECIDMVPGVTTKLFGNIAGFGALAAGYAFGKINTGIWGHEMADSKSFQTACSAMLMANGIRPHVVYERAGGQVALLPSDDNAVNDIMRCAPIIVVNHVSYLDVMVLPVALSMPKFVSKTEVQNWPLFGVLGQELDYLWVDRGSKTSRSMTLEAIEAHAADWEDKGRPLVLFPEGTTSSGAGLLEFRKGAFVPGRPVLPVLLKYTGSWDPSNPDYREAAETGEEGPTHQAGDRKLVPCSDADWAAQFCGHIDHSCIVYVCERYTPSSEEKEDAQLYADNVRKLMLEKLNELHTVFPKRGVGCDNPAEKIRQWRRRRLMKAQVSRKSALTSGAAASSSSTPAKA